LAAVKISSAQLSSPWNTTADIHSSAVPQLQLIYEHFFRFPLVVCTAIPFAPANPAGTGCAGSLVWHGPFDLCQLKPVRCSVHGSVIIDYWHP